MNVEFRDLRWAIAASQHRSLRQAAESLNVKQSTLSRRLRDMEYRLGATLFERTNGGTWPTTAGQEFLETAGRIIGEIDTAFSRLKAHGSGKSGHIAVGVCMALSTGNFRATLMEHQRRYSDVEIRIVDGSRSRLLSELAAGAIDVAVMSADHTNWTDKTLPLWSERVIVALQEDHPLCAHQFIRWGDLQTERLLVTLRGPGPVYEDLILAKLGRRDNLQHRVGLDRLLSLVGAGLGSTLVSEGATGANYPGVVYREMYDDNGPTRLNFSAYWRQANGNPTLVSFLDMLRERYPDLLVSNFGSATGHDAGPSA